MPAIKSLQPRYVYAISMGELFRFTQTNWRAMLMWKAQGRPVQYDEWGKSIAMEVHNITDLDPKKAEDLLNG